MEVFNRVLALFVVMVVGAIAGKIGLVSEYFRRDLSHFLAKIALPMFLLNNMLSGHGVDRLVQGLPVLLIALGVYVLSILLAGLIGKLLKVSPEKLPAYKFSMIFSNMGFLGLPVLDAVFGSEGVFYGALFVLVADTMMWTYGVYLFKGSSGEGFHPKEIITPNLVAILSGIVLLVLGVKLPVFLSLPVGLIGGMTPALSMVVLGLMLSEMQAEDIYQGPLTILSGLYRLLLLPLLIYAILKLLGFSDYLLLVPVIISGMPVAAMGAVQAANYGKDFKTMVGLIVSSTLLSLLMIPLLLKILL